MRIVTLVIIGIIVIVYFTKLNFYNTGYDIIDYELRAFYHANMTHLIANGISFWSLSFMEEVIGWGQFLFAILFIWIVSGIILYFIHKMFPSRKVYTVGFSGVIFGLMVVYLSLLGKGPVSYTGLLISILPQLFVRGVSFEGHLAGIIAGAIFVVLFPVKNKNNKMIPTNLF
jgi:rhomboid domain-containing protein 1